MQTHPSEGRRRLMGRSHFIALGVAGFFGCGPGAHPDAGSGGSPGAGGSSSGGGAVFSGGAPLGSGGLVNGAGGAVSAGGLTSGAGGAVGAGAGNTAAVAGRDGSTETSGGVKNSGGAGALGGKSAAGAAGSAGGTPPSAGAANGGSTAAGASGGGGRSAGGAAGAPVGGSTALPALTVYLAGDSIVSNYTLNASNPKSQAGWGQMLKPLYTSRVTVVNHAIGGRTARHFIQEGRLEAIVKLLNAGDYLLIQFGTNDSNTTATYELDGTTYPYYAAAETDFKTYLTEYIEGARSKQATPVLVTPPPRNSAYCNGGRSLGAYGQAMLELGTAKNVAVVDLGLKTHTYLKAICPKPTTGADENFFKVNADGSIDGTHFQENGARRLAGFIADGIAEAGLGLDAYRIP